MAEGTRGSRVSLADFLPHLIRTQAGTAVIHTVHAGGRWERVFSTGGVWQSATLLGQERMEPAFAYQQAFGRAFELVPSIRHLLAIGGGGFAFPKWIAAHHPDIVCDVVEIDPAVIAAARRWFYLDEAERLQEAAGGSLNVICADGRQVLDEAGMRSYDAIVLDAFVGSEPVRSLATQEAFEKAHEALTPEVVLLANVVPVAGDESLRFLRDTVAGLSAVFAHVAVELVEDERNAGENYMVFASDHPLSVADAIPFDEDFLGEALHDEG